ncbi:organic hydroperoxide resistance protein [Flavobacterium sp. MAH-1]|uniref:Organic hydroperoxide resistance protein n=1 Tax=Flavobacterium agri TaxID=2743471 RepID=A0A7Y8XZ18_9FLAO|nr:organic hydroperoxide resistance protein [Flavobacterium agri]NUY79541.1 organic hydroperoxide resistance protein [Flavobacterium agri]NYA69566.1 organic hydroperoxide resistance protein [Flavobacterium agri]
MENQIVFTAASKTPIQVEKVIYTAKVHIDGGREGSAKSDDGQLDIALSTPGSGIKGTNPEQLLAAGWSACFIGAIKINAAGMKIRLPKDVSVDAEVDLTSGEGGYALGARLNVNLPGLTFEQAKALVEAAHQTCPYSKVTSGNINVTFSVSI